MRAALVPGPCVLDLTTGVVCSAQTLSTVTPVLTHIPLPSAEHLDNNGVNRLLGGLGSDFGLRTQARKLKHVAIKEFFYLSKIQKDDMHS